MVPYQGSKQPVGVHRWQKKKTPDSNPSCRTSGFGRVTPSRHSHVQWRESNEVSCLCCFLLVMSECNLGDIILTFSHVVAAECRCWLRHLSVVNVTVCTHSRPAETSAAGELAKPNWEAAKRWGEGRGEGGGKLIKCVGRCDSSVCFVCSHVPLYVWDKYSGSIGQNEPTTQIRVPARCQIKIRDGLDSTCASSILLWITVSQGWKWW